jgi:hypothetical protein
VHEEVSQHAHRPQQHCSKKNNKNYQPSVISTANLKPRTNC